MVISSRNSGGSADKLYNGKDETSQPQQDHESSGGSGGSSGSRY